MIPITQTAWQEVLAELRRCDKERVRAWLHDLELPKLAGGVMTIAARNEAQVRHLEQCRESLARCAQVVLGRLVSLDIQLASEQDVAESACDGKSGLRADFTLEHYVTSHENKLARAGLMRVLQEPGGMLNPFFVHGPHGAGKTHLLQAACHTVSDPASLSGRKLNRIRSDSSQRGEVLHPLTAIYFSAEDFIARFVECFEEGVPQRFKRPFMEADLVALDDVGVFSGKMRSQEELFHVVNGLLRSGKQLVLAADRPPGAIPGLEPRIASRLSGGLVIAMDAPGVESRMRIIEQKNRSGCYECPPEALRQIAERCAPRELDGILSRLDDIAQAHGGRVTMDLVDEVFRDQTRRQPSLDGAKALLDNGVFA